MNAIAFVWCSFSLFNLFFKLLKGDMRMNKSLRDQLKEWKKQNVVQGQIKYKKKKVATLKKKEEKLSDWDLKELMGTNGPRYVRKRGGAYTQR